MSDENDIQVLLDCGPSQMTSNYEYFKLYIPFPNRSFRVSRSATACNSFEITVVSVLAFSIVKFLEEVTFEPAGCNFMVVAGAGEASGFGVGV